MVMTEMQVGMVLMVEVGGAGILFRITTSATADHAAERGSAIVRRLEVMVTPAIVKLIALLQVPDAIVDADLQVGHALHFRVLIDRPQREPVVFVVVLVQVFPFDRNLPVGFVLLQMPVPIPHVHRQVPEVPRDLELVLLAEERTECPFDRRRPADFLLVQGDRAVHVPVFLRAR